ncbi:MAG: hypothetical protein NW224_16910 [Leptolyngbyaceae cyanobacterium bins.302]|nr:hypothetical protein [Leptolyngbyaceae cyanobacterium bins.302]
MGEDGLWSAIVVASKGLQNGSLDELFTLIDNLSHEEKTEVFKRLQSSMPPQTQTNNITGPMVIQISGMDKESISLVLQAIAERMGGMP